MSTPPPAAMTGAGIQMLPPTAIAVPDMYARDATIAWLRGEFAAANAIIDSLCGHITQINNGEVANYEQAFAAIHRRRMNWMPVVHMQKFYSIGEVVFSLRSVAEMRMRTKENRMGVVAEKRLVVEEEEENSTTEVAAKEKGGMECLEAVKDEEAKQEVEKRESSEATEDSSDQIGESVGSFQEEQSSVENIQTCSDHVQICSDHEACATRPDSIKTCKGFTAKEHVKGHMMNIVKGLKMYEDIFIESELSRLAEFIDELRAAGRNGELPGETFIFFNKQLKGNKREIIQLGVPIFQSAKEESTCIEPIPSILQNVIDHLVQWHLIPESRKPNSCIINFFEEGEYSQPYFKPPHLDNPISTLCLYETTMAFGRALVSDSEGNYKGSLTLPIKKGSLIVMRGNSADMARHVVCPSPSTRVCITFLKVRPAKTMLDSSLTNTPLQSTGMVVWKPENQMAQPIGYNPQVMSPTWGMTLPSPIVMIAPPHPIVMNPTRKVNRSNGTGVFLPWTVGPKKYIKHLPPRIQRRRLHSLALPPQLEMQVQKPSQIPCIAV